MGADDEDGADALDVLVYRDTARRILADAAGELALGRVRIGVETLNLGPELASTTFHEQGGRAGFRVHHHRSQRERLRRDRPSGQN